MKYINVIFVQVYCKKRICICFLSSVLTFQIHKTDNAYLASLSCLPMDRAENACLSVNLSRTRVSRMSQQKVGNNPSVNSLHFTWAFVEQSIYFLEMNGVTYELLLNTNKLTKWK